MFSIFNKQGKIRDIAHILFGRIVDQSRQPKFYAAWAVPDTLDGRFDLIILHVSLVVNRLEASDENKQISLLIRHLQEVLFDNMDMSLREMGVGDMSVGKKVKIMAEAYFGRKAAYQAALRADKSAAGIAASVVKNIYREQPPGENIVDQFVAYIERQAQALEKQSDEALIAGDVFFEEFGSYL